MSPSPNIALAPTLVCKSENLLMKYLKYLFLISLLISSCSKEEKVAIPGQVIITGHITNYNEEANHDFVDLVYFDMVENRNTITQSIDDSCND